MAEEAAMSRVYGGIHYRFDGEQGLVLGRAVGREGHTVGENQETGFNGLYRVARNLPSAECQQ